MIKCINKCITICNKCIINYYASNLKYCYDEKYTQYVLSSEKYSINKIKENLRKQKKQILSETSKTP